MRRTIILLSCLLTFVSYNLRGQTTVVKVAEDWQLLVDGKPFIIKGVGFGYSDDVDNYDSYFAELKFLGVNAIRTWGTDENTEKLMDTAEKYDIKVMLGIWMRHGRPGMEADDSFDYLNDTLGKKEMYDNALAIVEKYKNHPALLTWGIGNEVYLNIATDPEKEAYSKLLEKICRQIKKLDNNHPITSVEAWTFGLDWWHKFVPSIDIYGLNSYGPGASLLSDELVKRGIDKPYIITEFNVIGEWDIKTDKNGVKPEPTDAEKYATIVSGYKNWIQPEPVCLGVYFFHYANNNDFGAVWLLSHFKGMTRPTYWAIREAYTGKKPKDNVPEIKSFNLIAQPIASGSWITADLMVSDTENDTLEFSFFYNQRTGSRKRRDQLAPLNYRGNQAEGFEIQLPQENGGIKVYAMARDSYNNVGIASTSIYVTDNEAATRKYLVPKAILPFNVYHEGDQIPYVPSALMGNYPAVEIDLNSTESVHAGKSAIKISYKDKSDWYGVGFVDPPNDWGNMLGGYDLSGAKTLSFWARASYDGLKVTVGLGIIEDDKPFPDTAKKSVELTFSDEWQHYEIKLKKLDLSCIRSGFVIFSSGQAMTHSIYLDEIVYK